MEYQFDADGNEKNQDYIPVSANEFILNLTPENLQKVKQQPNVKSIKMYLDTVPSPDVFPFNLKDYPWSVDNYGPLQIPKKGVTITLSPGNIDTYRRLITVYEHNTLEEKDGKYIINGKETNTYTTKYNYYWMMGDNRHRSQDSRYWGFVPETHVVGRASLIWFSWNDGPRWNRFFKPIK